MEKYLKLIEAALDGFLPRVEEEPSVLHEAMRYAVGTGGKRIRPVICLASAEAVGGQAEEAICPACAIELLHNYTLVHDDLPAMDNDVERRGKPTVWRKFGEANAILAGDALLSLSCVVAAQTPRNAAEILRVLGEKGVGVVRGQVADLDAANRAVDFIYQHKTADLFVAAATMGALAAGATPDEIAALDDFARNLGLAFQYEDDLLDGDGLCSREETERRVRLTTDAALKALKRLRGKTDFLASLAQRLVTREV